MAMNLLSELTELVSPELIRTVAGQLGGSEAAVSKGLGAAIPTLLGGVAGRADNPDFMSSLFSLVTDPANDESIFDKPESLLGNAAASLPVAALGGKMLQLAFGSNIDKLTNALARYAGVNPAIASSLMKFGAPLVMSSLGKMVKSGGLNAGTLGKMLLGQKDAITRALPSDLGRLDDFLDAPAAAAREAQAAAAAPAKSIWRWLLPLLAALVVFWLLSQFMGGGEEPAAPNMPATTASAPAPAVLYFTAAESGLPLGAAAELSPAIAYLKANAGTRVRVTAYYSDDDALARQRAASVRQGLIAGGVDGNRIVIEDPVMSTDGSQSNQARSVSISIDR